MIISVAMAVYNGEKYIKEQLVTILDQTIAIDEIIISDDGSTDSTIEIIESFRDERIIILTDNPKKGYCGNFEWALKHTHGDIIFLADQDDVWDRRKVEKTIEIFCKFPNVNFIISNGILIDKTGKKIDGVFNNYLTGDSGIMDSSQYLSRSIWNALANGMCMGFTEKFKNIILPFPRSTSCHDRWIAFCAMCENTGFYLNENLVGYRIHDNNTSMRGNVSLKKRYEKGLYAVYNQPFDMVNMSEAMLKKMEEYKLLYTKAFYEIKRMQNLYYQQIEAFTVFPLVGAYRLIKLYRTNSLYRSNGKKWLFLQIFLLFGGRNYMSKNRRYLDKERN